MEERLRRSLLYVPASSEPMLRKAAARAGRGAAAVDGEMVEALHAAEARRTLARGRQADLL